MSTILQTFDSEAANRVYRIWYRHLEAANFPTLCWEQADLGSAVSTRNDGYCAPMVELESRLQRMHLVVFQWLGL